MMRAIAILLALSACHGGSGASVDAGVPDARLEGFDQPDIVCPGPSCGTTGDGVLKVGAAKRVYTPVGFETYTDENMDKQYQSTEPYMDLNHNGKFDGVWLFGGGRAAMATNDDVEVRAIAFVEGDVKVALVYVDCIGLLVGDMDIIRNRPEVAALGFDHIIIGATHAHDAPDTVGLWGPSVAETGREDFVLQNLYDAAAAAIVEAAQTVQPAQMTIAQTLLVNDPANPQSGTNNFNKDIRDPVIFDPTLTIARFTKAGDPTTTIGTIVNWADHPEVAHFSDTDPATITAHYPHWLRDSVENGVTTAQSVFAQTDLAGLGGVTVFVQGALGGQIGSLGNHDVHPPGPGGTPILADSHAKDQALGVNAAAKALTALQTGETVSDLPLSLVSAAYNARIDNTLFHVAFLVKIIGPHPLVGYNPDDPIDTDNEPWLPLRATYLQIGPLGIVTVPGELHPELWVGGYDQSWTWGYSFYDTTKPNLPDFSKAPQAPYMRDLVKMRGAKYPMVAGLAEDYVGYIVPAYNYALDPDNPYINEAEGDHYEEVYSLGPLVEQHAIQPILQLLQYQP